MNDIPPDWDFETRALREAAAEAGIRGEIRPSEFGLELESSDDLIARLKAHDRSTDELASRRSRRRRISLLASSVAAVGVLVVGVLQPWTSTPVQAMVPAILDYEFAAADAIAAAAGEDPAAVIQQLADAAGSLPTPPARSGTQYVVTDNWYANIEATTAAEAEAENSVLVPQINETWLAPDGSLRIVERRDDPLPADGRGLPAKGEWDEQPLSSDETSPVGSKDPTRASTLPTDPDRLRDELLESAGCTDIKPGTARSLCLYQEITTLNYRYVVSPQLNAAIWKMLHDEEGFRSLGEVKDRAGRAGVGISLIPDDTPEYRYVLIADPKTGQLLGSEQILIAPVEGNPMKAPAIMSFTAILESKYVD